MITKDSRLPDVIRRYPGTRKVFDAYGLHGCGGAAGPSETVEFFARVHGVPLEKLLRELEAAKEGPGEPYAEALADVLYRRFFRAAIVVVLTAGATLGAVLLFLYGQRGTFTSLDLFEPIGAHANAMVFGWVGLFVMGFAYQGFPRFKYVRLWRPELANLSFYLMISGLALRASAAFLPFGIPLAVSGGLLEAAAVVVFVIVLARTLGSSPIRDDWDRYVWVALGCFWLAAMLEPPFTLALAAAPTQEALIRRVADYAGPYRDVQLLGFAGFVILGVGQRILPAAFGFRPVGRGSSRAVFWMLGVGLAADIVGWLIFRRTAQSAWALISWGGVAMYALGALWMIRSLGGLGLGDEGRSTKFIRAAFAWLAVACLMMIVQPLYLQMLGVRFSHAFHGAIRHAFTVGFISMMILGVSSKVVPILKGIDLRDLPALWVPFALLNAGNAVRVASQIATDWIPGAAFPVMGVSGFIEVLALAVWGVHLWRLMGRAEVEPDLGRPDRISAENRVAQVLDWFPETLEIFEAFGFREIHNPILRATIARRVTVRTACDMKKVDWEKFVAALNERISAGRSKTWQV